MSLIHRRLGQESGLTEKAGIFEETGMEARYNSVQYASMTETNVLLLFLEQQECSGYLQFRPGNFRYVGMPAFRMKSRLARGARQFQ